MPVMRAAAAALVLMLAGWVETAAAGQRPLQPLPAAYHIGPLAPDCGALAARHGARGLWFGAFSGTRLDVFFDKEYPHYAQGCFLSEYTCRRWLHENLSFLQGGNLNWMRCQPGVPARAIY